MTSRKHKSKLSHDLWMRAAEAGGEELTLARDPLHRRYEVNRHGIDATMDSLEAMEEFAGRYVALLTIHGFEITRNREDFHVRYFKTGEAYAVINKPYALHNGEARLHISVN